MLATEIDDLFLQNNHVSTALKYLVSNVQNQEADAVPSTVQTSHSNTLGDGVGLANQPKI